jgi:hypothetical protein
MRQRAAIVGAKLDFVSESGNGLMVRIEVGNSSIHKAPMIYYNKMQGDENAFNNSV